MTSRLRLPCLVLLLLAAPAMADAQESEPSPWRFGVSLGGLGLLGAIVEYWHDDFGIETNLSVVGVTLRSAVFRLSPKWRVGTWDGGEASWRVGVLVMPSRFEAFHGVELGRVTDGGHIIGGSYNLPLVGAGWGEEEEEEEDQVLPPAGAIRFLANLFLSEFSYRYQPGR